MKGIIQLVAEGEENIYINEDPEITLFKTIYRRHTQFSKEDMDIRVKTKVGWGKETVIKLNKYADILKKIYLVVDLPKLQYYKNAYTKEYISELLSEHNITWTYTDDGLDITDTEIDDIETLISDKITELETERDFYKNLYDIIIADPNIQSIIDDDTKTNDDLMDYINTIILRNDSNYTSYNFMKESSKQNASEEIVILQELQKMLYVIFRDNILERTLNTNNYIDENIGLLDLLEKDDFKINMHDYGELISVSIIPKLDSLALTYIGSFYTSLDAYKLFTEYVYANDIVINNQNDIDEFKLKIYDHVLYNLGKNLQIFIKTYSNIGNLYKFLFYKRYKYNSDAGIYNTTESFVNASQTNAVDYNDLFTREFTIEQGLTEPDGITNTYISYINNLINPLHIDNKSLFTTDEFMNYFNDVSLWEDYDISNYIDSEIVLNGEVASTTTFLDIYGITNQDTLDTLSNTRLMNMIPYITIRKIYSAIKSYIDYLEVNGVID